jgi:hypothetical protein
MCTYVVALACSILGGGIGSEANKLSSNIWSEDVDIKECFFFGAMLSYTEFFETKFELENVTKRSYVNKQMCEV